MGGCSSLSRKKSSEFIAAAAAKFIPENLLKGCVEGILFIEWAGKLHYGN